MQNSNGCRYNGWVWKLVHTGVSREVTAYQKFVYLKRGTITAFQFTIAYQNSLLTLTFLFNCLIAKHRLLNCLISKFTLSFHTRYLLNVHFNGIIKVWAIWCSSSIHADSDSLLIINTACKNTGYSDLPEIDLNLRFLVMDSTIKTLIYHKSIGYMAIKTIG